MSTTALLFPGQGSQEPGMGRDLAEANADIMALWKKAERISGHPLRDIYWSDDTAAMARTNYLQPALTVANMAVWMHLAGKCQPMAAAGHSLGEYSALAAAGVLPLDAVLELVSLRGRLMNEADPDSKGAMAAVLKLNAAQVTECIEEARQASGELLVVANYNTPAQFVASGTQKAITALQECVKVRKGRALPLAVSGAFHSPLLAEAAAEMEKAIHALPRSTWNNARFPVFTNTTGKGFTDANALQNELCKQMTSSVFWVDTVQNLFSAGARHFVECGPKNVLSRMVDPILAEFPAAAPAEGEEKPWLAEPASVLPQ